MAERVVLVTGFGLWGAEKHNPSTDVARAMDGLRVGGVRFVAHAPLPVDYGDAARDALAAAKRAGADAILALGLASRSPHVRFEKRATNAALAAEPDTKGETRRGVRAEPGGPDVRETHLDVDALAAKLHALGVEATRSDDAGGFVCNDLYYRLLAAMARGEGPRDVVFVHVPANAAKIAALPRALAEAFAQALV